MKEAIGSKQGRKEERNLTRSLMRKSIKFLGNLRLTQGIPIVTLYSLQYAKAGSE